MVISTALFERAGIRVDEGEVEALVVEALERVLPPRPAPGSTDELPAAEQAALRRAGVSFEPTPEGQRALARSAAACAALVASGLSVADAAARPGVDASRVRHRLAERTLTASGSDPVGACRSSSSRSAGWCPGSTACCRACRPVSTGRGR